MDDQRLEQKLEKITEKLSSIDITLASQHVSLKDHMRRTELLEEQSVAIREQLEPLKRTESMIHGALKLVGVLAVISGIVEGTVTLLTYVKGH